MRLVFNPKYLLFGALLFTAEVFIALFVKDKIVRPFVGDVLVVVLLYCLFRIFLKADYRKVAAGVFLLACAIEILQYFDYVRLLGWQDNRLLSVVLGRTFEWTDFGAYSVGFLIIIAAEKFSTAKTGRVS